MSKKVRNFAPAIQTYGQLPSFKDRDLAQLVAHTSGGREVAGSSPVIPTKRDRESFDSRSFLLPHDFWKILMEFCEILHEYFSKIVEYCKPQLLEQKLLS